MRRSNYLGLVCIVMSALGGCDTRYTINDKMIAKANEIVAVMKGITDEASAKAAEPKLKELGTEMDVLKEKARQMDNPSDGPAERLPETQLKPLRDAYAAISAETTRIARIKFMARQKAPNNSPR